MRAAVRSRVSLSDSAACQSDNAMLDRTQIRPFWYCTILRRVWLPHNSQFVKLFGKQVGRLQRTETGRRVRCWRRPLWWPRWPVGLRLRSLITNVQPAPLRQSSCPIAKHYLNWGLREPHLRGRFEDVAGWKKCDDLQKLQGSLAPFRVLGPTSPA